MDSLDRRRLRENYVELVRNLNPEHVTDYLFQERVLNEEDCESIQSGPTRAQRMRVFLSILPKKGEDGLAKLLFAMRQAGYMELATQLEAPLDPEEILPSPESPSPPDTPGADDPKLMLLKEQLEQQSEVVASMQAEMAAVSIIKCCDYKHLSKES